jgi:hypothetical protein
MADKKPRELRISGDTKTLARNMAQAAADPIIRSTLTTDQFMEGFGELDLTESVKVLKDRCIATHNGDLKHAESMLAAQAHTLDAIFNKLARRAAANMGEYLGAADTYFRLALRAQGQCRATLETLATIKNPPVVFAKQANIAHGHQQVNNGDAVQVARGQTDNRPTELLEHANEAQWLDAGKAAAAGAGNPPLATMEEIHRATYGRRKGRIKS